MILIGLRNESGYDGMVFRKITHPIVYRAGDFQGKNNSFKKPNNKIRLVCLFNRYSSGRLVARKGFLKRGRFDHALDMQGNRTAQ